MVYFTVDQIMTALIVRRSYDLLYSRYSRYFKDRTRKCIMFDDSTISRPYNDRTKSVSLLAKLLYSRFFNDCNRKCIMIDNPTISRSYNDRTRSAS